ncbi:MAG: hypothetical protein AAB834_07395 [Patescibacteria group bacterium]
MTFALQDGKLSLVLAELDPTGYDPLGTSSDNVSGNSRLPSPDSSKPGKKVNVQVSGDVGVLRVSECAAQATRHPGLVSASVSQLRKLAEYEHVCDAGVAERASFFVPTPKDAIEAVSYAADVAATLKEFAKQGVAPLVIIEPTGSSGNLDSKAYSGPLFRIVLDTYFAAIKANGITDQMMGMWVSFPEANIPVWDSVNPDEFAANVNATVHAQKAFFPGSKASIMLDSKTYPLATSWENGKYVSLLPYVKGIDKGLIDSFGFQGFPWAPPADEGGSASYDPEVYLPVSLAIEAAKSLGVKDVWLNTGTFGTSYAKDPKKTVKLTPLQRQGMLNGVLALADTVRAAGLQPTLHIFAENKSSTEEGIDWSYWAKDQTIASPARSVFKTFVHDAAARGMPLWIYDSDG